jgi:mono/diheme cytochrome c family protein
MKRENSMWRQPPSAIGSSEGRPVVARQRHTAIVASAIVAAILAFATYVFAAVPSGKKDAPASPVMHATDADAMRFQGEQRFRANCSRCHAAPHKFPPRMMATVVRHMRVRATITDEDMRLVLFYMTQ